MKRIDDCHENQGMQERRQGHDHAAVQLQHCGGRGELLQNHDTFVMRHSLRNKFADIFGRYSVPIVCSVEAADRFKKGSTYHSQGHPELGQE